LEYYLSGWNRSLYESINGLAGHSLFLDTLMTLPLDSNLFKAGLVAGCFIFAWHRGRDEAEIVRGRSTLVVALFAAFLSLAVTQIVSRGIFLPRPVVLSQGSYALADGYRAQRPLRFRQPLAGEELKSQVRHIREGAVAENDLHAFPSDHAGFYLTIAVGTALVCWWAGLLAIMWVAVFVIGSKIFAGQHTPLDVLVSCAIGLGWLAILRLIARRAPTALVDAPSRWTVKHPALSAVLLFFTLFEVTDKMDDVRQLLGAAGSLAGQLLWQA
jgi:membrane-associated phospholipid phosphatase